MALKRKRVAPPQFYDVESNILYPDRREAKKGKFDDLCRICTSPTSTRNELINIFGVYGKNLKLSEMIDKFLPIVILESDGFSHSICFSCRDILIKMDSLYTICQTSDLYFYQQRNNAGTQESEMVEMFDGDATSDHLNCEPEVVTADLSGWCLPELSENVSGNEDCTTEFSPGEEDTPSTSRKSATPTKKSVSATVTKRSATVTMTKKSATPTKTKKSPTYTVTKMKSLTTPKTKKSATSNESHNSSMTKSKSASAFRTKMSILATKNKRQKMQQDSDTSSSEDEGNEDSDDPDNMAVEYKSKTALLPKTLPLKCEYCATLLKSYSTAENHYEFEHGMQLCTTCFVHYQTVDELNQHYTDQHPEQTSAPKTIYFQCEYCINNFCTKHKFKSHLREKHQVLMCFKCSATFEDQAKFEVHLQSKKHGMVCRICKADFWALDTWKKHLQGHYSYDIVKVAMPTENSTGIPVEISEFSCSIEPQDGQESTQYASKTLPFQCTFCDVSLSEETVAQDHYKIHNMQLCMYCFNDFSTKRELDGHIVDSHTFSCALCPYSIIGHNANALKDHLTTVHADIYFNKNRVYGCGICHMRFGKKWKLKKHMTEVHEKFTCYVCLKCYSDDDSYQKHLEIEDHGHNCKVCNADFNEKQTLVQHVKKHHPDLVTEFKMKEKPNETKFTCQVCNSVHHKLYTIKRHYLEFHQKFMCHFCRLVFDSHSDIDAHSLEVHGCNTSWSYQCSECSKYFETVEMLTLHVKTVHEKSIDKFLCDHCGKAYRSKIKLREHVLNIHNGGSLPAVEKVKCDICNILVREKILEKHRKRHTMVRDIVCGDCGKKFVDTRGLKLHMKTIHRDYNPSIEECPHCRLSLEKIKMKKHIEEEHTAEWSYICNECNFFSKDEAEIWHHCTSEHGCLQESSIKPFLRTSPYQCETCFVYLANAFKLNMHRYVDHSDTNNIDAKLKRKRAKHATTVVCELCGDTIKKQYKSIHMYMVHKIPQKYPCEFCDRSYRTEELKLKHVERAHSEQHNSVCDICNRGFATRKNMMTHRRRVHFENQELPCRFCDKKLKNKDNLNKHERMHSADMPFRCETCDIGFHRKAAFNNHMSRHDNNLRIFQPWKKRVEIVVPAACD